MAHRSDLPAPVAERVRRHRARLDRRGVRLDALGPSIGEQLDSIDEATSGVLVVDALPGDERALRQSLERLRTRLAPGVEVRIVSRSRPLERSTIRRLAGRFSSVPGPAERLCDVPAAVRASGFTIGSIERIEVETSDGASELWIDVVAIDLTVGN